MKRTRPLSNAPAVLRLSRTWLFADGTRLPVVSGGDADDEAPIVPEDLTQVSDDDLNGFEAALIAEFDRLHDEGSTDVAAFEEIAAQLDRVRAEIETRETKAQEDAEKIKNIRERVHPAASDEPGEGDDGDGGDDPGDGDADGGDGGEGADEPKAGERELVTAAAGAARTKARASASGTSRRAGRPVVTQAAPRVTITAAADLPGVTNGSEIDLTQVAISMHDKARTLSDRSPKVPIARFHLPFAAANTITKRTSAEQVLEIIERVSNPFGDATQGRQALLAAGGWCVPSQNMYELLALDGATGLLDLPTVRIDRGGINVPSYIGIDAADGALWTWSEDQDELTSFVLTANDVAGGVGTADSAVNHLLAVGDMVNIRGGGTTDGPHTVLSITDANTFTYDATGIANVSADGATAIRQKGCFRIPCPTWTDYRLAAYGLCLEHGNLTNEAFPELERRYVQLVMNAHLHRMSAVRLAKILANTHSDAVTASAIGTDSYGELVSALLLNVQDFRSQHKVSEGVPVEIALPSWVPAMLAANLAMRPGVDLIDVQRNRIVNAMAVANTRVQFLEDYQAMWDGTAATTWPTSVQFAMWAAGTFTIGNGGRIDLSVQRDSTQNKTNDHTVAWTEDFDLLARRGPKARRVTVTLSTDGVTGCCPTGS